jgi:hypothetical protein
MRFQILFLFLQLLQITEVISGTSEAPGHAAFLSSFNLRHEVIGG